MGVDAIVVRHSLGRRAVAGGSWVDCCGHQRRRRLARAPDPGPARLLHDPAQRGPLDGLRVAIVGDIKHSRVARSNVLAFTRWAPRSRWWPRPRCCRPSLDGWPVAVSHDLDAVLPKVDVVYLLRMQAERQAEALLPSLREYTARYGLTRERARLLADDALVMHPGPMNRGVEIAAEVADLPRSVITRQVANGVAVRMAVLFLLLGSAAASDASLIRGGRWSTPPATPGRRAGQGGASSPSARPRRARGATVLDAGGCMVAPGLVDLHAHLRQPGREEAETVETGRPGRGAGRLHGGRGHAQHRAGHRRGGVVREVLELGRRRCATCASPGPSPSAGGAGAGAHGGDGGLGVRLFTDDGPGVQDARLMRRALEYASALGGHPRPALRGRRAGRRRAHARGRVVEPPGLPGSPPRPRS